MQDYALGPKYVMLLGEQEARKEDGITGNIKEGFLEE